jgi:DNA helicase II / ATP-dependent DNA helicase PcrA
VCDFIKKNLGILIESHRVDKTDIRFVDSEIETRTVFEDQSIIKLFYQQHYGYNCYSKNWGDCKGEDKYQDVCVVLSNPAYNKLKKEKLGSMAAQTLNKLYVACSRPKGDLIIIPEGLVPAKNRLIPPTP